MEAVLSNYLIRLYTEPTSSSGVERHHKVGKRVHIQVRNKTGPGKVERRISIAYNSNLLSRSLPSKRHSFDLNHITNLCADDANVSMNELELATARIQQDVDANEEAYIDPIDYLLNAMETEEQDVFLLRLQAAMGIDAPEGIEDSFIFSNSDD